MTDATGEARPAPSFTVLDWIGVLVTLAASAWLAVWPFRGAPILRQMLHDFGGAAPEITALALSGSFVLSTAALSLGLVLFGLAWRGALPRRRLAVVAGFAVALAGAGILHLGYWLPILNLSASVK